MRSTQLAGNRGSLKWIQKAVALRSPTLEGPILEHLPNASKIDWLSPLRGDDFAEYRDRAFLELLGLGQFASQLNDFWPERGPQWDALGRTDNNQVLLIEAKAHIGEFCSPPSKASKESLARIKQALGETATQMGLPAKRAENWHKEFYQYANRLAHLAWLRRLDVDAWLVLVSFCCDAEMPGKTTEEAWEAAYQVADFALGIPKRHPLSGRIIHVYPDVSALNG